MVTNKRLPLRRCTQLAGAEGVGLVETQPSSAERGHFSGIVRHRSREEAFALVVADSRSAVLFHLPLKPVAELAAASPAARFTLSPHSPVDLRLRLFAFGLRRRVEIWRRNH